MHCITRSLCVQIPEEPTKQVMMEHHHPIHIHTERKDLSLNILSVLPQKLYIGCIFKARLIHTDFCGWLGVMALNRRV